MRCAGQGVGFFWRAARSSCLACRSSVELPQAVGARHVVFAYAFLVHPAACVERLEVCGVYAFARVVVPNPQGCWPQACAELYGAVEILVAALLPVVCHLHVVAVEFLAVWAVERLVADVQLWPLLKQKVEAGAEYAVTQLFYDNRKYFDFVERVRKEGITIPIIPGIKPLKRLSQLSRIPKTFKVDIPEELTKEVLKCKDDQAVQQVGIEWCIQQCKELIAYGVPSIHFYSVSAADSIKEVAKQIY